jgi:2-keto-4-pentenoate hydratase/2-oxohepta-3-ene-1,7-dioic acid hydratase in catechol pathway
MGKSFDTFAPIGPCIVTADEIADPNDLHVRFWNNGELRHNYNTDDMEHRVPELVAFVTSLGNPLMKLATSSRPRHELA